MKADIYDIQNFLEKQEMQCVPVPKNNDIPFDQLYIPMGVDEKGRELLLQMKIVEEDLSESYRLYDIDSPQLKFNQIHFFLALPFAVKDECVGEVARLILLLNKSFGLPGFEFSEVDRLIYFRSVLMVAEKLEELILIAAIGNLMTYVDTFSQTLESVAEGKRTFEGIIKVLQKELKGPSKK